MTNEALKIYNRPMLSIKPYMEGDGVLISAQNNKIDHKDSKGKEMKFYDTPNFLVDNESYDYILAVFVTDFIGSEPVAMRESLITMLDMLKSNGHLILYLPNKNYAPTIKGATIPYEILMHLKHIGKYNFEIVDFQTFGENEGAFESKNLDLTEYAFQMIIKKANNSFNRTGDLNDEGQLVEL